VTRVAVVGPGSVGLFFAAHLAAAGTDVLACARRPFGEYVVESPKFPTQGPARVLTDPADVDDGPYEWVLLTVKAHQTEGAAGWLRALCGPDTTVVVVQNGIEHEERVRPLAGVAEVLPAVVYCGAELLAPGHIRHFGGELLFVPERPESDRLVELFEGTPAEIRPTARFTTELWRKLGSNVVANGITALTRRRMEVMREPAVLDLGTQLLREAWTVGALDGAELGEDDVQKFASGIGTARGGGGTSMLYDRLAGRPTEHDAIYGAVVRAAERHGVDAPLCRAVQVLVEAGDRTGGE
jgi:2-dehydropantoate 2-reductase